MLEASLTHELIHMAWQNVVVGFCDGKPKICAAIRKFLAKNTDYVRSMVARLGVLVFVIIKYQINQCDISIL